MIGKVRSLIIKLLGGVTRAEYDQQQSQIAFLTNENSQLSDYKEFAKSIYYYAGSYPVWKAQSEYREMMMHEMKHPLSGKYSDCPKKAELLDIYLGRVVDSFAKLIAKSDDFSVKNSFWSDERLPEARGDDLYLLKTD